MAKYFISGNAGSGKSTVIAALQKRGYTSYDTDELPQVTKRVAPKHVNGLAYSIVWDHRELELLLKSNNNVFVAACVANQADVYPLFDKIFCLIIDKFTLEQRLIHRTNNDTGKDERGRRFLLGLHDKLQNELLKAGAIPIDATQPPGKVVDQILMHSTI